MMMIFSNTEDFPLHSQWIPAVNTALILLSSLLLNIGIHGRQSASTSPTNGFKNWHTTGPSSWDSRQSNLPTMNN